MTTAIKSNIKAALDALDSVILAQTNEDMTSAVVTARMKLLNALKTLESDPPEPAKPAAKPESEPYSKRRKKRRRAQPQPGRWHNAWLRSCPKCGVPGGQQCLSLDEERRVLRYMHPPRGDSRGLLNQRPPASSRWEAPQTLPVEGAA